tara:strand:- start:673 stop:837 length:165 start_codon:yes stop_codon:yes gene_type:complete
MSKKKHDLHKIKLGVERQNQKEQGYFDGRFMEKVEKPKRKDRRKPKHKNQEWDI